MQKENTSPVMSSMDLVTVASTKGTVPFPTSPFAEDAQKLMNAYFLLFASSPGKLILSTIYDRRTLADGLRDLKDQAQFNNGQLMVSLAIITYQGPVGNESYYGYELQTPLHSEAELRLRTLNWAIPHDDSHPWAILLIVQPYRGIPLIFKLSDFGITHNVPNKFTHFQMTFPKELNSVLRQCTMILVDNKDEMARALTAAYGRDFPCFEGWRVVELPFLNNTSNIGDKLNSLSMKDARANPRPVPRHLIRDIAQHLIFDPLRFDTDDVFAQRMANQKDKKQMAAGLLSSGPMNDGCMLNDHNMMSHMTGLTQALWLNFLAEVIFHPNYMAQLTTEQTSSSFVPNEFIKEGITAIQRDLYREGYKMEKHKSPYNAPADDFLKQLESAVPGLLLELEEFFNSMRVHAIYLSLIDCGSVSPHTLFSKFLRDHSGNNRRMEPYFLALRVILMNFTKDHTR
ncbi:MAG: hypothetical protein GY816_15055 [Cytophagales bacterium]|nr:hypothetical protein [Cytophagales bacterium]